MEFLRLVLCFTILLGIAASSASGSVLSELIPDEFSCTITKKFNELVDCSKFEVSLIVSIPVPEVPVPKIPPPGEFVCNSIGTFRDPTDCSVFYVCRDGDDGLIPTRHQCNAGLLFDLVLLVCNFDSNVQC